MDPFTLGLVFLLVMSFVVALPAFADAYRLLMRRRRKPARRARLARLPPPEEALKEADGDEIVAYLRELFADGEGEALRDEEVKARFEEVVRIVERRTSRQPAA
jgi:hypothetical protein